MNTNYIPMAILVFLIWKLVKIYNKSGMCFDNLLQGITFLLFIDILFFYIIMTVLKIDIFIAVIEFVSYIGGYNVWSN